MGTAKRERQKANRQLRLEELQKVKRKEKAKRTTVRLVALGLAFVAIAVVAALALRNNDSSSSSDTTLAPANSSVTDSTAGGSTTTAATIPAAEPVCPKADGSSPKTLRFSAVPTMCIDATKTYVAKVETNKGTFEITLDAKQAPKTVNNFVFLSRYHFYDGVAFHRVIPGFVVQGGDATGNPPGTGGPGYEFVDELTGLTKASYVPGTVAMANSGPNTNGSQFFIVTGSTWSGEAAYSVFGKISSGMDTVTAIEKVGSASGTTSEPVSITTVTITER